MGEGRGEKGGRGREGGEEEDVYQNTIEILSKENKYIDGSFESFKKFIVQVNSH